MGSACYGCVHGWCKVLRRPAVSFLLVLASAQHYDCALDDTATHVADERAARFLIDPRFDELDWEAAGLLARAITDLPDDFADELATMIALLGAPADPAVVAFVRERIQTCRAAQHLRR